MANFIALKVARDRALGPGARENGIGGARLTAYTSAEVHFATTRAADMLGLGSASIRQIGTDDRFRVDMAQLAERIEADRREGFTPFAVVATAGTVPRERSIRWPTSPLSASTRACGCTWTRPTAERRC